MNKEELGQIYTPKNVAKYMVSLIENKGSVLDPCFGNGVFLDELDIDSFHEVKAIELDTDSFNAIKKNKKVEYINADYLSYDCTSYFDTIIMNPPYIRHEKIDELQKYGVSKFNLKNNLIYKNIKIKSNLYVYFIVKALNDLKNNGELIVIIPSTWIKHNSLLLKLIKECSSITSITYVDKYPFGKSVLVNAAILRIIKCLKSNNPRQFVLQNDMLYETEKKEFIASSHRHILLNSIASVKRGISTCDNSFFMLEKNSSLPKSEIISNPKKIQHFFVNHEHCDYILKIGSVLSEETIDYIKTKEANLNDIKKPKTLYSLYLSGKEWYKINYRKTTKNSIVFSYIVRNSMKFLMLSDDFIIRDNFYVIDEFDYNSYILFSLLNNFYTYLRLEQVGKHYGAGLLKLQKYDLDNLYIIDINVIENNDKEELADLGYKLFKSSSKKECDELILQINKIISKYEVCPLNEVIDLYIKIKKERADECEKD